MKVDTPALRACPRQALTSTSCRPSGRTMSRRARRFKASRSAQLLRTIVVRRGANDYVFVLVPRGRQIDWPKLRAHLGVKRPSLPDEAEAREATGYERGAITPFGSMRAWPVIADTSVAVLDRVALGGGARGVNLHVAASDLVSHLNADVADVTHSAHPEGRITGASDP